MVFNRGLEQQLRLQVEITRLDRDAAEPAGGAPFVEAHKQHLKALHTLHDYQAAEAAQKAGAQAIQDLTDAHVLTPPEQKERFKGCVYIEDLHAVIVPGEVDALDQKRFDVRYSGMYLLDYRTQKNTDSAWEAFTRSRELKFPRASATYFDPRDPPGHLRADEQSRTALNTFLPLNLRRTKGNATPFLNHVRKILPNGNDAEILIAYLAACVQYPGVKAKWAPLLQGVEGNGKSVFIEVMAHAIGRCYTHAARASEIDGRFNSYLYGKLFVAFNEVKVSQDKASVWETLKSYITEAWQQIEYKGGAIVQRELMFNILFASNHTDALPKTRDARRICPLFCAQQSEADLRRDGMLDTNGHTSRYFDELFGWLEQGGYAIVADYLATYQIPDELNFAKRCRRAPMTTSTEAAIGASMGLVEQEVTEAVESGAEGFRGGWIASHRLHWLLDQSQRGRAVARNKRTDILEMMGYVLHPGLADNGRVPVALTDGQRPRLFVAANHPSLKLEGAAVAAAYVEAQRTPLESVPMPVPAATAPATPIPAAPSATQLDQQAQLAATLHHLGWPNVMTAVQLLDADPLMGWLVDGRTRDVPARFATAGYLPVKNPAAADGLWKFHQYGRHAVYGRTDMAEAQRVAAAQGMGAS